MRRRIRRWWARHRPRIRTLTAAEAAARLRSLADQVEEAIGTGGWLTIDDDTPMRRPTMDLNALIARWRRAASHTHALRALTPQEAFQLCADELEAHLRSHAAEQGKEAVPA